MEYELRKAILDFRRTAIYLKKLGGEDGIWLGHMGDYALSRVLLMHVEGRKTSEMLGFLERATESFHTYIRGYTRKHRRDIKSG